MKRPRRHHSPEFTRDPVALVVEPAYSCAAAGSVNWKAMRQKSFLARGGVLLDAPSECMNFGSAPRLMTSFLPMYG